MVSFSSLADRNATFARFDDRFAGCRDCGPFGPRAFALHNARPCDCDALALLEKLGHEPNEVLQKSLVLTLHQTVLVGQGRCKWATDA
jgi:hypothetical protein